MNYIKHLTGFFDRITTDKNLNPTHISLYIALFQAWNINRFRNPISITRDEMMRISKICSKATYHKCMRELNAKEYIKYEPSFNPYRGSLVYVFDFSNDLKPVQRKDNLPKKNITVVEQVVNTFQTSTSTSNEQVLVPSINNTNILNIENNLNLEEQAKKFQEINNQDLKNENVKEEKSSAKKEEKEMLEKIINEEDKSPSLVISNYRPEHTEISEQKSFASKNRLATCDESIKTEESQQSEEFINSDSSYQVISKELNPTSEEVKTYFLSENFPEQEGEKFFNYFKSVGWLVGGKIPMMDWQAAAKNWMLNANKFSKNEQQPNRAKQLNTSTYKDYSEPL